MFADYHVHTAFSDDSEYPMGDAVTDAIRMGMDEICFTDHVDYGIKRDWDAPEGMQYRPGGPRDPEMMALANVDYPRYAEEIARLQAEYKGKIEIRLGLEFGMQVHTVPRYEQLFRRYPFDFIILSVHQIEDKEFWTQEFQRGRTQQEYNMRYYEEILMLAQQYHDYSVLGHLDSIRRYDREGAFPFENIREILTEIFRIVIADGKGIEVNTSSWRYGFSDLTPSRDILKLYRELGGEIVTIGSDTHKREQLGTHIEDAKRELRDLGFHAFHTFEKMKPCAHDI